MVTDMETGGGISMNAGYISTTLAANTPNKL